MANCKKPADMGFMTAIAKETKKEFFDLGKKDRKMGMHLRTLEDSVNVCCWMQLSD